MQKYINQLCNDIKAATRPKDFFQKKAEEDYMESYFQAVERFIHETPTQSLGSQIALQTDSFPDANLLTNEQCIQLTKALQSTYLSYGISLDIPDEIPTKVKYQFVVKALEQNVFLQEFGIYAIECCHYDFDGYCAFGIKKCPCYQEWAAEVVVKKKTPIDQLEEIDALEVYWFDFLAAYGACKSNFEQSQTPNKAGVKRLWQQLEKAHQIIHKKEVSIYFGATAEELPEGDYRTLFDWLEVGAVKFPKRSDLNDLELQVLTMALVQLIGKELIVLHILDWTVEKQYKELVAHFSRWMKRKYPYFQLICQPATVTLYEKVKTAPKKFKSDYEEFLDSKMEKPKDLLWFQDEDTIEDDELPF